MRRIVLLVTITIAIVGCSKDVQTKLENETIYDPSKIVTFTTSTDFTRGTPINDVSGMTDMGVYCAYTGTTNWAATDIPAKMVNRQLTHNIVSEIWEYTGTPERWDPVTADDRYTFFAYAPFATDVYNASTNPTGNGIVVNAPAAGIPTLTYTVPTDVTKQPDLMVAAPKYDLRYTGELVPLQMEHALTCIGFKIEGRGEKVTGISIEGVSMTGTLAMDGSTITWTNLGSPTTTNFSSLLDPAKLTSGWYEATGTVTDVTNADGYLMMIPQVLPTGAKVKITFSSGSPIEIALNSQPDWIAGKIIVYSINLNECTMYVGMFGGELKKTGGVCQFERPLYVQCANASIYVAWQTVASIETLINNKWDGRGSTYSLHTAAATVHPAANLCYNKNHYGSISYNNISDYSPSYIWYLPAQDQLMACWASNYSFSHPFDNTDTPTTYYLYWSATESGANGGMTVNFINGLVSGSSKTYLRSARCVRETP